MKCFRGEKRNGYNGLAMMLLAILLLAVNAKAAVMPVSEKTQELKLKPGWNLVTLTKTLDSMPGNVQKFMALNPVRFDVNSRAYAFCEGAEDLKAGVGYWVFSRTSQTVELVLDSDQMAEQPTLKSGWNMVGMTDGATWVESATAIWEWEDGCFKFLEKKDLKAGKAYWIFMP